MRELSNEQRRNGSCGSYKKGNISDTVIKVLTKQIKTHLLLKHQRTHPAALCICVMTVFYMQITATVTLSTPDIIS